METKQSTSRAHVRVFICVWFQWKIAHHHQLAADTILAISFKQKRVHSVFCRVILNLPLSIRKRKQFTHPNKQKWPLVCPPSAKRLLIFFHWHTKGNLRLFKNKFIISFHHKYHYDLTCQFESLRKAWLRGTSLKKTVFIQEKKENRSIKNILFLQLYGSLKNFYPRNLLQSGIHCYVQLFQNNPAIWTLF